ncbi:MAG TPA: glycosyltransferase family 4 protein [Bacteroidota bacterium]|nr:glycosyltransferase family 4 protein [Bacteroidota bacterium]
MNILVLAYTQYLSDARPRRAAETLVRRGDTVEFLGLHEEEKADEEIVSGVHVSRLHVRRYRGSGMIQYILSYLKFFFAAFAKVSYRSLSKSYDAVHIHTMPDFMVFTAIIAKFTGARIVLDIHDTMPELYAAKFNLSLSHPIIRFLRLQEVWSARFADRIIATHDLHKNILVSHGIPEEKITVVVNYPDPAIFQPLKQQAETVNSDFVIVYHGTLAHRLGIDVVLRALVLLKEKIPNILFKIIGEGDSRMSLEQMAESLGIAHHVWFSRRMIPVDQIPAMIGDANIGVVPNRTDGATTYMMPVKLLEYLAMEIPVVAARTAVTQHYFSDGMIATFESENPEDLAKHVLSVAGSSELRANMVQKMKTYNSLHNWDIQKATLYSVLDN